MSDAEPQASGVAPAAPTNASQPADSTIASSTSSIASDSSSATNGDSATATASAPNLPPVSSSSSTASTSIPAPAPAASTPQLNGTPPATPSSTTTPTLSTSVPSTSLTSRLLGVPDTLKVIVHFRAVGDAPQLKKSKFMLSASYRFVVLIDFLRKHLHYKPTDTLVRQHSAAQHSTAAHNKSTQHSVLSCHLEGAVDSQWKLCLVCVVCVCV